MKRALLPTALALCAGAILLSGLCPAAPDTFSPTLLGEGEDATRAIEALRPATETDLNAALRLGWLLHVYANDNAAAKTLFESVVKADPASVWARFGLASIAKLEGDYAAVCEQMTAVLEHRPEHPLTELALHQLRGLWPNVPEARSGKRALLLEFLDNPAVTSPEVRGLAFDFLRRHLEWHGLMSERDALLPATGAVRSWRFAGPFGPLDDLAFFARLEPDADPTLAESYTSHGKAHRTRRHDAHVPQIEPEWVEGGVYYAETFVRADAPVCALLRVTSGDSVRIELNGGTVYLKDTFHTFAPRTETVETTLPAGWSRLRVKYQAPDFIVVRLLDEGGRPLAVEVDPSPRRVEQSSAAPGRAQPTACEAYLDSLAAGDPDNPLVLSLTAQLEHSRGNTEAAKVAALRCVEVHDGWASGRLVAGIVLGTDRTQPERIARSRAKAHYRRAIKLAGACPVALYALALYERQERRFKEAIEKLEQCVEQAPKNALWQRALYDIYTTRGWAKEREAALKAMLELNGDAPGVVHAAMAYYRRHNLFDGVREAEMRLHKGTAGSSFFARHLERTGRLEEAIAEYERLAEEFPDDTSYRNSLVELYKKTDRFDDAARLVRAFLADEPRDTGLMGELAALELERGRRGGAIRLWRRMLDVEPAALGVRKALALHGMKEVFDRYAIDIEPYLADESLRERYAEYASVMVVDYAIEQVFANGSGRQYTHQLVLVNTKAGIRQWGETDLPGDAEVLELRVIKPDGSIVEPELIGGKGTISLTGLAEGDFIEMKYIEPNYSPYMNPRSFLGSRFFFCSATEPMHLTRYLVMAPVSLDLKIEQVNMDVEPKTWTRGGWRFHQWERHEVEPIRPEPNSVSMDEYMPWVRVGFGQRAGFEPAIYEDNNIGLTTPSLEVRRAVEKLITPEMGHEAIVRALHAWVNTKIDGGGSGPSLGVPASHTLGARRGSRMALLKAMLDVAGIRSHVVMVRPSTAFDSDVFPNSFGYGLLLVEDEAGRPDWWIDLNNKFYPLGFVHPAVQGGRAVVLRNVEGPEPALTFDPDETRTERRVPVRPETHLSQQIEADLRVDDGGALEGTVTVTLTGLTAASLRGALERVDEDRLQRILQMAANNYFRGATLGDYTFENRKAFNEPLVVRASFTAPKYAHKRGRSLTFNQPLFALDLRKSYTRVPERKTPLALFSLPSSRYTIVITLPEGATLKHGLESLALESTFGSYRYSFEFDEAAHRATIEREFILPIQRVQPADYPDFADFCRSIDEHEEDELKVFLPKAPKAASEPPEEPQEPTDEEEPAEEETPAEEEAPATVEN